MLSLISKLIHSISLRKVILWTLAIVFCVFGFTAYEHRTALYEFTISQPRPGNEIGITFSVSEKSKQLIKSIVNDNNAIEGIAILSADLRLNERVDLFHYSNPKKNIDESFMINKLPLFTKSYDNNKIIVKLLNGEFSCGPYSESTLAKAYPDKNKNILTICSLSLPPYYGDFSGYIMMALNTDPDIESQLRIKQQLESLASDVYLRDVVPTAKKSKY